MDVLLLNQNWFADELREAGHRVFSCGLNPNLDIPLTVPLLHIDTVVKNIGQGFNPELVIFLDNSAPLVITGLEEKEIPSIFYSVDTHHHFELHRYLHHIFDKTFVAQKDFIPQFTSFGAEVEWLPLWASRLAEPSTEKQYGAVFVGTMNPELNPDRVKFFEALKAKIPVTTKMGNWWEIFPFSEIVINQTVKSDLNFRVFEAMVSGAMLLTEESTNGLTDLFIPGEHLVTYQKNNVEQAAELITQYLNDIPKCRQIGLNGRQEVMERHTVANRYEQLNRAIKNLSPRRSDIKYYSLLVNCNVLRRNLEKIDTVVARHAQVISMKCLEQGMKNGERMTDEIACHAVTSAVLYDRNLKSNCGEQLLNELSEQYPKVGILAAGVIRSLLNRGDTVSARKVAKRISNEPAEDIFLRAESAVCTLLGAEDTQNQA